MTTTRIRLLAAMDRVVASSVVGLLVGTALGFGGAVWWAPAVIGVLTTTLVLAWLARVLLAGRLAILKGPWTALGALAVGLAVAQSAPLPGRIAEKVSPNARAAYTQGVLPDLARRDDPEAALPGATDSRTPITLDRPATLRWLAGAGACLALFWVVSHFADSRDRLYLVWGCVVGVFLLNAAIAAIQVVGQAEGLYGFVEPGQGPRWGPNLADALAAPGATALRPVTPGWTLPRPDRPMLVGTLMGGPGALVALGSLGLPLALGIALQLMAPRGSRDGLWTRLADSGQGSLLVLLYASTLVAAFVLGLVGGPKLAMVFGLAIVLVGVPSLVGTGIGWKGLFLTAFGLAALGGGVALGDAWPGLFGPGVKLPRVDFEGSRAAWREAAAIARDFPIAGVGLGGFAAVEPYYKARDAASITAMSSLLQWWAEAGVVGLAILGVAALWAIVRLPGGLRRVGSADRALAFGMVGAGVCFAIVSCVHWTVELAAVALAASAVAGTANRWLAGGTDLFVERG